MVSKISSAINELRDYNTSYSFYGEIIIGRRVEWVLIITGGYRYAIVKNLITMQSLPFGLGVEILQQRAVSIER